LATSQDGFQKSSIGYLKLNSCKLETGSRQDKNVLPCRQFRSHRRYGQDKTRKDSFVLSVSAVSNSHYCAYSSHNLRSIFISMCKVQRGEGAVPGPCLSFEPPMSSSRHQQQTEFPWRTAVRNTQNSHNIAVGWPARRAVIKRRLGPVISRSIERAIRPRIREARDRRV